MDWSKIEGATPTESADRLDFILQHLYNKHFPLKMIVNRSCDAPWITKRIKRYIRNRKREYARSGRSERWRRKKEKCEQLILVAKRAFFEKIKSRIREVGSTKSYFQAVKLLQSLDAPTRWIIQSMFPGMTDAEISERAASFFNEISQEYVGLQKPCTDLVGSKERASACPEPYQVAAKLRYMRKPRSTVAGDINPKLVLHY